MAKITKLDEFAANHKVEEKPAPVFSEDEFQQLLKAAKHYLTTHHYKKPPEETPRQRRRRITERLALESAIRILRQDFNPNN